MERPEAGKKPNLDVVLSGAASYGGDLVSGSESKTLQVTFKCLSPGVSAVLLTVPLLPHALGSVSWRLVKVCGNYVKREDFEWTAGNVLLAGFVGLLAVIAIVGTVVVLRRKAVPSSSDVGMTPMTLNNGWAPRS